MMRYWFAQEIIQRFAGSLLHFLWQGVVVALVAAISLRLLKKRSAETRYAVSIAALIAMLAAPVITFMFYAQTGALTLKLLLWAGTIIHAHGLGRPGASDTAVWTQWIVVVWAIGVFVFVTRLMMSWHLSRTLIGASEAVPDFVLRMFEEIKQRVIQNRTVRLLANARIDTPIVVGCFRPVVLLPLTAITGLHEDHFLAVLAHELAHIRRHDFLLNILQRGVESILFYHPAVWWLSGRIRDERENCCDDVAVRICGDRRLYVKALLDLESKRCEDSGLAVAASGGSLVQRSRRILGLETPRCDWQAAAAPLMFMVVWMVAGIWQSTMLDARPRVAPVSMPPSLAAIPVISGLGMGPLHMTKAIGVLAAIVTAQPVVAEPPPGVSAAPEVQKVDTGSIRGTVTHPGTTDGISDVTVTIQANGRAVAGPFKLTTDATGNFSVRDVPAGSWMVNAEREGYLPLESRIFLITVTPQKQTPVALHLIAAGAIRGRITDSNGAPVAGATVEPVLPGYDNSGRRTWLQKSNTLRGAITDDHGEYRVYGCQPDDYYVRVLQRNRTGEATPTVVAYFPGPADPALAMPVTVGEGVEATADIVLPLPVTRKVSGNIHVDRTATDKLNVTVYATLRDRRIPAEPLRISSQITGSDGSFSFAGVQPGSYDIRAEAGSPVAFTGRMTLDVGERDVSGIALSLHLAATLKVHVSSVGRPPVYRVASLLRMVSSDTAGRTYGLPIPDTSGTLSVPNLADGLYVFRAVPATAAVQAATGMFYVADIRQGPRSVIETSLSIGADPPEPLEISISTETGTVQGNTDAPAGASIATVVLVPETAHRQNALLYRSVRADASGHFIINGVAPGRYTLFAWESNSLNATQLGDAAMNAEFLSQYETRGVGVTVNSGAAVSSQKVSLIRSMVFPPIPPSNIPQLTATPPGEPAGAVLEGSVTRTGTTEPIAGATVTAEGTKSLIAVSDANGRFRIAGVPAGTYRIRAERDGYLPTLYSQQLSKNVTQDQHVDGIVVNIRLGGAISGRLLGINGKPLAGTRVIAGSTIPSETVRYPKSGSTNDRGEYRIFGLEPGTYIVGVSAQGTTSPLNRRDTYVRTYFPNTPDLFRAVPVDVAEGANVTNIDFTVQQVPTVRISGKVINPLVPASNSSLASPAEIQLIPQEPSPLDTSVLPDQQLSVRQDGTFEIANVAPGTYYVVAIGSGSGSNIERPKAWTTVRVGQQDITGVNLTIQPSMKVTGRLVGGDRRFSIPGTLRLIASGAPINWQGQMVLSQTAVIDDTGAFTVSNVPAGNYRFAMPSSNRNQYISDVRIGAASVLRNGLTVDNNTPLEGLVVVLGGAGTLVGTVLNSQGSGASAVTVVLQPDSQRSADATLYKTATSSTSGRFTITDVPPGNYTVLAFQGFSVDPSRSAPLLEEFATSGQPVTVAPDAGTNVTVTLIPRSIP